MRSVKKGPEPRELLNWKALNAATPDNLYYGGGGFPGDAVRKALLKEQLHLCAYTMKELATAISCEDCGLDTRSSCHTEHLLPQTRGIKKETIDYQNMVACYPPSQSSVACEYGAKYKDDYDPTTGPFVSPLSANAQRHFEFDKYGVVKGVTEEGITTVEVLNLNHHSLVSDRAAVVRGFLEPKPGRPISAAAARRLAVEVLQPDAQHRLSPYCFAVAALALAHAKREDDRAARLKKKAKP
jgi:hypothetical protein